ncbi:phostensin-like [Heterodontus francisci]|uniref:phostensin-like n=1 Tax=Heterodontus francisci TaxID=7792 RepID=UPI00355C87ED
MSSLPQWKVQLLERKRRDEEEGRRKEKVELERLARMPAWKREIIERRRARLCSGSSQSESPAEGQPSSGGLVEARARPSVSQAGPGGGAEADGIDRLPGPEPEACDAKTRQGTVLQENIGPVYQNHFIQQEKQRYSELEHTLRARQAAELLNHIPGVKTIQVDNVTIIESNSDCLESQGTPETVNGLIITGVGRLNIQSSLSRSVEDLNTFEGHREGYVEGEEEEESPRGRVSRLLCKFGQRRGLGSRQRPTRSRSTENIIERSSHTSARHRNSKIPAHTSGCRPLSRSPSPPLVAARRDGGTGEGPYSPPPHTVAAFRSRFEARSARGRTPEGKRADSPRRPPETEHPDPPPLPHPTLDAGWPGSETPKPNVQPTLRQLEDKGETVSDANHLPAMPTAQSARTESQERPVLSAEDSWVDEQQARTDPSQKWGPLASAGLNNSMESKLAPGEAQAQALAELRARSKKSFTIIPRLRQEPPPEQEIEAIGSSWPGDSASSSSLPKPQPVSTASSSCAEQASVCLTVAAAAAVTASCLAAPDQRDTDNGPRDGRAELGPERQPLPELGQERVTEGEEAKQEPSMSRLYSIKPPSVGPARSSAASPEEVRLPAYSVRAGLFKRSEELARASPPPSGGDPLAAQGTPEAEAADVQGQKGIWAQAWSKEGPPAGSGSPPTTAKAGHSGGPQRKSGKTITINPRKIASRTTPTSAVTAENGVGPSAGTQPVAVPGVPVKKRYPTVEEIQVIGGYLTLQRSCLAKTGTSRRKLNISFNECELESTFEYPSELALLAELGTEQDEEPPQTREPDEEEEEEEEVVPVSRLAVDKSSTVGMAIHRKPLFVDESCR